MTADELGTRVEKADWQLFSAVNGLAGIWRPLDVGMETMARFGPAAIALPLAVLSVTASGPEASGRHKLALRAGLAFLVARAAKSAVNHLYARPRPYQAHPVRLLDKPSRKPSFPSNHAAEAWAMAWAARGGPRLLTAGLTALAVLVGVSRVYVGKHYPSDVLGGTLIGIVAGSALNSLSPLRDGAACQL